MILVWTIYWAKPTIRYVTVNFYKELPDGFAVGQFLCFLFSLAQAKDTPQERREKARRTKNDDLHK